MTDADAVLRNASNYGDKKLLTLVECPICGESWRQEFERGDHVPMDVAEHLLLYHDLEEASGRVDGGAE